MPQVDPNMLDKTMAKLPSQTADTNRVDPGQSPIPGSQGGKVPFFDTNFGGGPYEPKPQPQTTFRGGTPAYYLPPEQLYPLQTRPINNAADWNSVRKELYKQLVPTSINLRNYGLQQLLGQVNTPMEQMYAAQATGQVGQQRTQQMDQIRSGMSARGIYNSGMADEANLATESEYVRGMGNATMAARDQANTRQNQLLQQLLSVPEADLRFYQAIRSGSIPAGSLWSEHAQDYGMMMYGTGTAIRKGISAAAGGGDAGGGMGGMSFGGMGGGGMMGMMGGMGGGGGGMMGGGGMGAEGGGSLYTGY